MTRFNGPVPFNAPIPFNGQVVVAVEDSAFPANLVDVISTFLADLPGVDQVQKRTVRQNDPNGTVGVIASSWVPTDQDIGSSEPRGSYSIFISTLKKIASEAEARHDSSLLVKSIRLLMYRDRDLQLALRGLTETSYGMTERVARVRVKQQRFLDDGGNTAFISVSVTQIDVDTDIT